MIIRIGESIITIVPTLMIVAMITLAERRVMGIIQRRKGPEKTGYKGILQAIADGGKLIMKETITLQGTNNIIFIISSMYIICIALLVYYNINYDNNSYIKLTEYSLIYYLVISSLSIYGLLLSGLSGDSKYSIMGSIRSSASMISYEVASGIVLISVCYGISYDVTDMVDNKLIYVIPIIIVYYITILAEMNRIPFDLTEAESELTAGPYTEYSSVTFAYFFLAEYSSLFSQSIIFVDIFLSYSPFLLFLTSIYYIPLILLVLSFNILLRATLPRIRIDHLIILCWNYLLPFSLHYLFSLILFSHFLLLY